ncbi:hypothetical protein NHX12_031890 [Muraenolepis orangiensis]|uniref:CCD97-like C-terminal domain-containing protein n=1 Tax=Muraenolepis orangiensis TaxID=630683 RepID=A0A9Q0EAH0_9TELE|nr:hypothetical protein NHX12_031890 [Muraenolepis orangiensis]
MWGEIDPPAAKPRPAPREEQDGPQAPEGTGVASEPLLFPWCLAKKTSGSPQDAQDVEAVAPGVEAMLEAMAPEVEAMLEAVALSGSPVKSQQVGDPDLTLEQRRVELLQQYRSRPLVFLERYQAHLKPQHLAVFSHLGSDPRAQHYCSVIQRRPGGPAHRTGVRNHRYAALRVLQREGQYFSEEQMRAREPLLYEQYVGQYLTEDQILERSQQSMTDGAAQGRIDGPEGCMPGGLAHILLDSYQERLLQRRGGPEESRGGPTQEEKDLLREEFIGQMHQRFLSGRDKDFNYSEVDENPDYDNLDIVSRDAEEKYFDDDEEEEEEEEQDQSESKDGDEECMME